MKNLTNWVTGHHHKNGAKPKSQKSRKLNFYKMPKYVIEREIPGAGDLTPDQLKGISQTSCGVLNKLGPEIQWVESFVTTDKIYCIYNAPNKEIILEHAAKGGFPANRVEEIKNVIKTLREALSSANYASIKESFEQLRTLTEVHLNSTNPAN